MALEITKTFVVKAAPPAVWSFLIDVRRVAECMPGASISEQVDDRTYAGKMTVKVGPVTSSYKGKVVFERLDAESHTAEIVATGQETRGKGGADMRMTSSLVEVAPGETEVTASSQLNVTGILAQMGRGMIEDVSDQIFQIFSQRMREQLERGHGASAGADADVDVDVDGDGDGEATPEAETARAVKARDPGSRPEGRRSDPGSRPEGRRSDPGSRPEGPRSDPGSQPEGRRSDPGSQPEGPRSDPGSRPEGRRSDEAEATAEAETARAGEASDPGSQPEGRRSDPGSGPGGPRSDGRSDEAPPMARSTPPPNEDVLDLGSIGAKALGRAALRLTRTPAFWITVVVIAVLLYEICR